MMTDKEIAEKMGEVVEYRETNDDGYIVDIYPAYHTDLNAAKDVLAWMEKKEKIGVHWVLAPLWENDVLTWSCNYYGETFESPYDETPAPTAPEAICAALEWRVKEIGE